MHLHLDLTEVQVRHSPNRSPQGPYLKEQALLDSPLRRHWRGQVRACSKLTSRGVRARARAEPEPGLGFVLSVCVSHSIAARLKAEANFKLQNHLIRN